MKINKEKVIALVRTIKPLFNDHERAGHVKVKGIADFVTEVDVTVQKVMREGLEKLYPDIAFMAEEKNNNEIDPKSDFWILDPVDGTTNLMYDYHASALSLAYLENGIPTFGLVYNPQTEELFEAEHGKGAFLNGKPIHVTDSDQMADCLFSVGTSPYNKELADVNFDLFKRVWIDARDIRRSGSAALDLCYVAAGRTDGFFERNLKPWDYAAGMLIVHEAGGIVTDFDGEVLQFQVPSDVMAGNGRINAVLKKYI